MKIKDFLKESNWTQGQYAKDVHGNGCAVADAKADRFCLIGAAKMCYPVGMDAIRCLLDKELGDIAVSWNDEPGRTFVEVRALVEKLDI